MSNSIKTTILHDWSRCDKKNDEKRLLFLDKNRFTRVESSLFNFVARPSNAPD